MRPHVPSNPDGSDIDARELVKAGVRQAGLSLEEWAASVLETQKARRASQGSEASEDELESLATRITQAVRPSPTQNYDALMTAIEAEGKRQAQGKAARTSIALESMAGWIEQTEERLNESVRTTAEHQDRMATALSQALSSLKDRLDGVEQEAKAQKAEPRNPEFPIQEAMKLLSPLSENVTGLRKDMSRLVERLEKPDPNLLPVLRAISSEIEHLRSSMDSLATREEIAALDHSLKDLSQAATQGSANKDLLTLAQSVTVLYRQIQNLSDEMGDGLYRHVGGEIERLAAKIDRMAESGVDRTVIDFLSSQIVDMRHDLAYRAEPRQIEQMSEEVAALGRQIAELRTNQVGRGDLSALKSSLEDVCAALKLSVATQEASDVPQQLDALSRKLDVLVSRPEPEPAKLDPIADQLALVTERLSKLSESRFAHADAVDEMIDRLSTQVQTLAEREPPSQAPLMQRFDRIEQELQQMNRQADSAGVERMLRSIDEKLDRAPAQPSGLDILERQIASLAERVLHRTDEPLQKALDEAKDHLKTLHDDAAGIAERAARAALKDIQPNLPDLSDLDALKQGFVELKALQTRSDKKTQETLRVVHEALETLIARFPKQDPVLHEVLSAMRPAPAPEELPPADRLEAAVRRLHAAALSQMEDVAATLPEIPAEEATKVTEQDKAPESVQSIVLPSMDESVDLSSLRANFIAAARRASQAAAPEQSVAPPASAASPLEEEVAAPGSSDLQDEFEIEPSALDDEQTVSPHSLLERLRQRFDTHRRPLLFGLALLILAAGTAQILTNGHVPASLALTPAVETSQPAPVTKSETPADPAEQTGSLPAPVEKTSLFQGKTMAETQFPLTSVAAAQFLIDPATLKDIPAQLPTALRQAAVAGDAAAIYEIASRAAEGNGLPQDMALALHLYERAAQAGLPPAQERFAMLLEKGIGTTRDTKQAAIWYERAAQGGNIRAMHNLATLIASGANGKPDYAAAIRWYSEAAEAGLRDSQFNMGVLYARGIGIRQDLAKAYKWFALAAAQGDVAAVKKRDETAARMSTAELSAAKAAVDEWRPRPTDPLANEATPQPRGQTASLFQQHGDRS